MHRTFVYVTRIATLSVILTVVGASGVEAQGHEHPSAERFSERAREAVASPLFASDELLILTLRTDIEWLRDERSDEEEVEGTVTVIGPGGTEVTLPVEVRTRGEFRRMKRNCNFPPLRLNFPRGEMDGTVFEGQDKVKLVTPCHDSRGAFQEYIYHEYLVYRAYQVLTPLAFRVRLVQITYEDIEGDCDTRTKYAFLIEDKDQMAARNRGMLEEASDLNPSRTSADYSVMMSIFQFMMGNTDWSVIELHNVALVHVEDGQYYTVPYDFDLAGAVNARYATVNPDLPIQDVRDRLFWGFCFPQVRQREHWNAFFNAQREAISDLFMGFELLDEEDREDALKYFDEFWDVLANEGGYERRIIRKCRG